MSDPVLAKEEPPKKVFVISPIGAKKSPERVHADRFLNYVVKKALPAPDYDVERADEDDSAWAITEAMLRSIVEADICVADITGLNPNVMYELALAHAMNKRVIIMSSDDKPAPFDIKDQRALEYGLMPEEIDTAINQLRQKATHDPGTTAMTSLMNPVATAFKAWTDLQKLETDTGTSEQAMHRVVERLEAKLDRVITSGAGTGRPAIRNTSMDENTRRGQQLAGAIDGYLAALRKLPQTEEVTDLTRYGELLQANGVPDDGGFEECEDWLRMALRLRKRHSRKRPFPEDAIIQS